MSKGDRHRSITEKFKGNFEKVEFKEDYSSKPWNQKQKPQAKFHHIMPDIEAYQAVGPEAGRVISSRSKEREYLRQHNLTQVGNEKEYFFRHDGKAPDNPTREW